MEGDTSNRQKRMDSMETLKPCPFCGHAPTWSLAKKQYCQMHGEAYQNPILGCRSSKCDVKPFILQTSKHWCIKIWNKRGNK
jgi:hypothetical protein